jgi:hypothetical protein
MLNSQLNVGAAVPNQTKTKRFRQTAVNHSAQTGGIFADLNFNRCLEALNRHFDVVLAVSTQPGHESFAQVKLVSRAKPGRDAV